jgi:hypothetical protein
MSAIIAHGSCKFKSAFITSPPQSSLRRVLSPARIELHCRKARHRWRESFWSPSRTLLTCVLQALNTVKSLRAAVADLLSHLSLQGMPDQLPSADPSAFAQARQRVPEAVFHACLQDVSQQAQAMARTDEGLWRGSRVILIDGACVSMPDTPELQKAFPQPPGQSVGCGFPIARLVALFDWHSGVVLDHRIGSQHQGEATLFRQMLDHLGPGTVALADRYFCSYVDIARIMQRGGDVVFRLHQRRSCDFRRGCRLPTTDEECLVTWHRPHKWLASFGISPQEFEQLPEQMTLRMVRTSRTIKGFRSRKIVIITTILDPQDASADELLALYRDRWMVEVNLRSIKTTLKMEILRGKSVDVVRKEILTHLLLYNLIRLLMWEAASAAGRDPHRVSFAGTLHRLHAMAGALLLNRRGWNEHHRILMLLRHWTANDLVPHRPNRFEPRRVKRRPKNYSRLTKPRHHYHRHGDTSCR